MTWLKIKFTLGVSVAALLVGAAVTVAVSQTSNGGKITVQEIAKQSQAAYAALTSYSDDGFGVAETGGQKRGHTFTIRLQRPKQYRVGWDSTGELDPVKGLAWSDGHENFLLNKSPDKFKTAEPTMLRDMAQNFSFAGGQSGQVASTVPGVFFDLGAGGDSLALVAQGRTELKREADENIGDVDCYVVVSILDGTKILGNDQSLKTATVEFKSLGTVTTVFWIGKQDHLIRKTKTTLVGTNMSVTWTDAMLTAQLNQRNQPVTQENLAALRTEMEKSQALTQVSGIIFTETHEHIVVNQKFSPSDFAR